MAWIDADPFTQASREIPLNDSLDLIYVGVLTPLKNVHIVIDAFYQIARENKNGRLWLAGKPENLGYTARLHIQVEDLDLTDRVIFTGTLLQRDLAAHMMRSRALILVSNSEGLPRVLIEAMLAGLPVIASQVGGVPEIVQPDVNGYLVPPEDVNALVATLRTLYNDPDIEAMGERARSFAQQFFSKAAYVDGYRKLLNKAISTTSRSSTTYPIPADNEQTDVV